MLRQLRKNPTLVERTPGCFYRKSKAYLHFHEEASGTYGKGDFIYLKNDDEYQCPAGERAIHRFSCEEDGLLVTWKRCSGGSIASLKR